MYNKSSIVIYHLIIKIKKNIYLLKYYLDKFEFCFNNILYN